MFLFKKQLYVLIYFTILGENIIISSLKSSTRLTE